MAGGNGKLFEPHVSDDAQRLFGALTANRLTRRVESPMVAKMRDGLRDTLSDAVVQAKRDRAFPIRTGSGYRATLPGARAFGTHLRDLRGYILAPAHIVAHERGTLITPNDAPQLAVPLPAALKPNGEPKLAGPNNWRMFGSFVWVSKRTGRGYIARKGPEGELILLYVFVDQAQLRKHTGFMAATWPKVINRLYERWGAAFLDAIAKIDPDAFVREGEKAGPRRLRRLKA